MSPAFKAAGFRPLDTGGTHALQRQESQPKSLCRLRQRGTVPPRTQQHNLKCCACCALCAPPNCCTAGGGYVIGSCQWLLNTVVITAVTAGLTIICPEYRLAPEHPFPAGLNDILSVYKAMLKSGGYNPKNVVSLGDSAGGGAVAAAAIQLQREKEPLPAALGMFSPWVDLATRGDTAVTLNAVDPVVPSRDPFDRQASGNGLAYAYVGGDKALVSSDPLVSPVIADWAALFPGGALPPTLIQVGLRETLLSDSVRLYHGMRQAAPAPGCVVLSPYEGMWHVFQGYVFVPEAVAAGKEMGEFFKAVLDGQVCK